MRNTGAAMHEHGAFVRLGDEIVGEWEAVGNLLVLATVFKYSNLVDAAGCEDSYNCETRI